MWRDVEGCGEAWMWRMPLQGKHTRCAGANLCGEPDDALSRMECPQRLYCNQQTDWSRSPPITGHLSRHKHNHA